MNSQVEWVEVYSYFTSAYGGPPEGRLRRHELSAIGLTTRGDEPRMSATQSQIALLRTLPTWENHPWES